MKDAPGRYTDGSELESQTAEEVDFGLSPMQQGMLLHSMDEPGVYVQQMVCRLNEPLDVERFRSCWQTVCGLHDVLRLRFGWNDNQEPCQRVDEQFELPWHVEDLSQVSRSEADSRLEAFLREDRIRGFEVFGGPLMRIAVFPLAAAEFQVIWTFHHSLLDGRSHLLVLQQVFGLYDGTHSVDECKVTRGRPYRDYIDWLKGQDVEQLERFWREELSGFTEPTSLQVFPTRAGSGNTNADHRHDTLKISADVTAKLRSLAADSGATLNNIIQAAWSILLARYTRYDEVVFGATRSCRHWTATDTKSMVGLYINTLPLRVSVDSKQRLDEFLGQLRRRHVGLREVEHTPLSRIHDWSDLPRGRSLFESVLVFEDYQMNERIRSQGGAWANREFCLLEKTNYPFTLAVYAGSDIAVRLESDPRLFEADVTARLLKHFEMLLTDMADGKEKPIGELRMLTERECRELLDRQNIPAAAEEPTRCVHELFEEQAERAPDSIAVVFENESLTYRELNEKANGLAHYLRSKGVGPDSLVGICIERSIRLPVAVLAVLKAGGAYIPLDPYYPAERLEFIVDDTKCKIVLTTTDVVEKLPPFETEFVCLDRDEGLIEGRSSVNPPKTAGLDNLIYVIYTSGSTGRPKGVLITHHNVARLFTATDHWFQFNANDVWTLFHSCAFDFSVWELWGALAYGGKLVVVPYITSRSPRDFYELLSREGVTVLNQTPSAFRQLIAADESMAEMYRLRLRYVIFGGEALDFQTLRPWVARHGVEEPRLINMYGITETTVHVTYRVLTSEDIENARGSAVGVPIPDLRVFILGPHDEPTPVDVPGEMHVSGPGLARGYLRRPELTSERFVAKRIAGLPECRVYKTGDLARYRADGEIEYLGRTDDQVKIRGFRIELGEIDATILAHPDVKEAVVVARDDEADGKRLIAYVVPRSNGLVSPGRIREYLRSRLPEFMVPAVIMELDAMPLTNNGKIDRRALPEPKPQMLETNGSGITDPLEARLAAIWERILGVRPIGPQHNFFELGGHSLKAIRMFAEIEEEFGKSIPLATLFEAGTIEKLADILRQDGWEAPESSLVPIQPLGSKPPFFCIHAKGGNVLFYNDLARRLGDDQPFYGLQARRLAGRQVGHDTVEEMAAFYIREIKSLQPEGPYYLGGSSFGGLAAYEIAQQLRRSGDHVALLALFDTGTPDYPQMKPGTSRFRAKLNATVSRYRQHRDTLRLLPRDERLKYVSAKIRKVELKYKRVIRKLYRQAARKFYAEIGGAGAIPAKYIQLEDQIWKAGRNYVPKPYAGKMTLFIASIQPLGIEPEPFLGWDRLVSGGIEVHEVPGHHGSIVKEPFVRVLAERLNDCISRTLSEQVGQTLDAPPSVERKRLFDTARV